VATVGDKEEEGDSALTVKKIGNFYMRYDDEKKENYYVRRFVTFTVSCVYTPVEQTVRENNVEKTAEGAN